MKSSGYSGAPLARKLGLKEGFKIRLINAPDHYYALFDDWPKTITQPADSGVKKDFIHYFATEARALREALPRLKSEMRPAASLWISWPKKSAGVATDVSESVVRNAALAIGLVDIKVCAVDEIWSGLKLVIPVKDRQG
jgi:hypothetical protein